MNETKSSDNISQVSLCGEKPKPNIDEGYSFFICVLVLPYLLVLFLFVQPSSEFCINLSRVT